MSPLAYLAATWLALNAGIATALAAAYRRHSRHLTERTHDFDRHADEALAVAEPEPTPEYAALVATFPASTRRWLTSPPRSPRALTPNCKS